MAIAVSEYRSSGDQGRQEFVITVERIAGPDRWVRPVPVDDVPGDVRDAIRAWLDGAS